MLTSYFGVVGPGWPRAGIHSFLLCQRWGDLDGGIIRHHEQLMLELPFKGWESFAHGGRRRASGLVGLYEQKHLV